MRKAKYEVSEESTGNDPSTGQSPSSEADSKQAICCSWDDCQQFLYNPETKKIMGRTPLQWGQLSLFYLVFYFILFGSFAAALNITFLTAGTDRPKYNYYDDGNKHPMLANPGLGMRPLLVQSTKTPGIKFTVSRASTFQPYVSSIHEYISSSYNTVEQNVTSCDGRTSTTCQLDNAHLDECNGTDITFGYGSGEPCVLLKLNRIAGWKPTPAVDGETDISITCQQDNTNECSNCLGTPEFYPSQGLPIACFPYCGTESSKGYMSPVVMVKFKGIATNGRNVIIYCKANAGRFTHNRETKNDKLMSTKFSIAIRL